MHAGFARLDITPDPARDEVHNLGYWNRRSPRFTGVRDRLFVRAATFGEGIERRFLFSVESIFDSYNFGPRATARIADEFGITPDRVWVACTHAHGTPLIGLNNTSRGAPYGTTVEDALVTAARIAVARQQPTTVSVAATDLPGPLYNRRPILRNGRVAELHTTPSPADIADPGPVDSAMTLLRFHDAAGTLLGAIWHYAIHGVCIQCDDLLSGDCMGRAMRRVETELPGDPVLLFLNGACGDVDPARMGNEAALETIATALSAALTGLVHAPGTPTNLTTFRATVGIHQARRRRPASSSSTSRDAIPVAATLRDAVPSDAAHHSGAGYESFLIEEEQALAALPETVEIPWQIWRTGDRLWIGVAGELFAATGQSIARALAPVPTHVVGYTGGWLGYFPPLAAYDQGGYEVAPARWSRLAPAETEPLITKLIQAARSLI